jgi:hypothetical protein
MGRGSFALKLAKGKGIKRFSLFSSFPKPLVRSKIKK